MKFLIFFTNNLPQIWKLTLEHIQLTLIAVLFSVIIGIPIGILISYYNKLSKPILGASNIIQAIPSIAILGLFIPFLGIGSIPAIVMVILYSLLPIVKNTFTSISNINHDILESAQGIGLSKRQILTKVEVPLALPIIMAGVRISAVTAVGLMTIAAFIGAGGLGFLIFSGIQTVDNNQILSGAIPACLLALIVDYIFGLIEKITTPVSLQMDTKNTKQKIISDRKHQKIILTVFTFFILILFAINGIKSFTKEKKDTITVAGKNFTEQHILVNLISDLIENRTDISVIRKPNLGGTQVALEAIKKNEIDIYIDYIGTIYGDTLKMPPINDVEKVFEVSKTEFKKQFNLEILDHIGFNNTYTLAVTKETADKYGLENISDLRKANNELTVGASLEFLNRADGLSGVKTKYGLQFKQELGLDGTTRYTAITSKKTDVVNAFSTDGLLKKLNLKTLNDDLNFFPPYYAVPVVRAEILEKYPEIKELMSELSKVLTDETMMDLNYKVDEEGRKPEEVSKEFLREKNLIR